MGVYVNGKPRNGRIVSFWLADKHGWIYEMLNERVKMKEALGKRTSLAQEMREILAENLKDDYIKEYGKDAEDYLNSQKEG